MGVGLCAFLLFPLFSLADEQLIVSLTLNQQEKGVFFVILRDDGDFLVRTIDLKEAGISKLPGERIDIEGEPHTSLASLEKIDFRFDESTLTLELTAAPELLPKATLDLSPTRRLGVIYPSDSSIFLNYGIDYSAGGDDFAFEGLTISNELGVRHRGLLLLTDTLYAESPDDSRFVRLNTSLTWDDRERLRRVIGGDYFAFSGELGSRLNMGGISFSKAYRLDPYFIRYPLFDFSGLLSLPSDVELYVDGVQVRKERFAPGEFDLLNFQSIGGAQTVEIVIRDAMGREQRILSPFYFTDQLLREGLHEYSYNLGLLRRDFGVESNRYADLVFSAFHRYGVTDFLNLGIRAEGGDSLVNGGLESAAKIGPFGLLRLEAAGSHHGDDSGAAGLLSYEYQNRRFRARLRVQRFSEEYRTLGDLSSASRRKNNLLAGIGYLTPSLGSFSVDFSRSEIFAGQDRDTWTLSWSRRIWQRTYLNATFRQVKESTTFHEAFLNFTFNFGRDYSLAAGVRRERDTDIQLVEARKNTPLGEGTGWNVRGERSETDSSETYQVRSFLQHNARHAILRGEYSIGRSETVDTEDLRLGLSGSLVYLGGHYGLTRPVNDSFGLVKVGESEGVRVYVNNQTVGRTNGQGIAIFPGLSSYYENQVAIEDKDIPIEYLMPQVRMTVSPPLRSGSCLNFPLRQYQGFGGVLKIPEGGEEHPLADAEITLATDGGDLTFWTSREGEFYFDNDQLNSSAWQQAGCTSLNSAGGGVFGTGSIPARVRHGGKTFSTLLRLPPAEGPLTDLGVILLDLPAPAVVPSPSPTAMTDPATAAPDPPVPARQVSPTDFEGISPLPPIPGILEEPTAFSMEAPAASLIASLGATPAGLVLSETGTTEFHTIVPPEKPGLSTRKRKDLQKATDFFPNRQVIHFPFDSSILISGEMPALESIASILLAQPELPIIIEGHTCRLGRAAYNLQLGLRRALTVKNHLIAAGVAADRVTITSFGEDRPLCREATEDCLRQNRRAVLILARTLAN